MEQQSDWPKQLSKRVGQAVKDARLAAGLKATELSRRCEELGLPIHRTTLSKIEAGRSSFDLAELIIIARALEVPPLELVYPDLPDGWIELFPGRERTSITAAQWFSGEAVAVKTDDGTLDLDKLTAPRDADRGIAFARRLQAASAEWRVAELKVRRAARESDLEELANAENVRDLREADLVSVVGRGVRAGATVDLDQFTPRVAEAVRRWVDEDPNDRARRVADQIRREMIAEDGG